MRELPKIAMAILLLSIAMLVGCRVPGEEISTEYGKINGVSNGKSVNGTGVFFDMFVEREFYVKRRTKISPRINKFQTIVWVPNSNRVPSQQAIDALDKWLDDGTERTLIYVGRDYEAQLDYVEDVVAVRPWLTPEQDSWPAEEKEEWLRQLAETRLEAESLDESFLGRRDDEEKSCEWFEIKTNPYRKKARRLSGKMAKNVRSKNASVYISDLLAPVETPKPEHDVWDSRTLLKADSEIFAFQLKGKYYGNEGSVIVVSNGSFLLNYGLVNSENQKLADDLINRCDRFGDVLFLESGPSGISVSKSDKNNHNQWSWIAEAPLRYIVPHFLAWGVLFCFVYFPIFGRPKNIKKRSTSTFRNHVNAIGKLLGKTKMLDRAKDTIEKYQEMVSGESKRNQSK